MNKLADYLRNYEDVLFESKLGKVTQRQYLAHVRTFVLWCDREQRSDPRSREEAEDLRRAARTADEAIFGELHVHFHLSFPS